MPKTMTIEVARLLFSGNATTTLVEIISARSRSEVVVVGFLFSSDHEKICPRVQIVY
jgi:hypothetical protein